jgi:hypothetical protein
MTTQYQELTKVVTVLEEAVTRSQGFKSQVEAALAELTSREAEIGPRFEKQNREHQAELSRYQDEVRMLHGTVTERVTIMEDSVHRLILRYEETREQLEERLTRGFHGRVEGEIQAMTARLDAERDRLIRESVQALQRLDEQAHEQLRRQAETMHHVEDVLERRLLETLEHRIGESFGEAETQARTRLEIFQGELHRTIVADLEGQRRHVVQTLTDLERAQREAEARLEATRAAAEATELRMRGYVDWFEGLMARPWYARLWRFVRGNRG